MYDIQHNVFYPYRTKMDSVVGEGEARSLKTFDLLLIYKRIHSHGCHA